MSSVTNICPSQNSEAPIPIVGTLEKLVISLATLVLNYQIITPFIFLFLIEVFPFKGTGSFFTTVNASYLFLIMGIMIGLVRKQN